jgi:hypothetical protein
MSFTNKWLVKIRMDICSGVGLLTILAIMLFTPML